MKIDWMRIKNDINGNPRYVCHFSWLLQSGEPVSSANYAIACKRANAIGGRKFHNKQYGGGIVFQSYALDETERAIARVLENA